MLLRYNKTEYENKIEYLRNNGYGINIVDLNYEDFSTDVEKQTLFTEFQLPNEGKSYKDYSAIVAWSDYLENDDASVELSYSGMPIPITFTANNNGNPVTCSYVFEDTTVEGIVKLTITVTGTTVHTDANFKYFIDNLRGLMFIRGDECTLDPDDSIVVPNFESFLTQFNGNEQSFTIDLANKTKFLSLGDDEDILGARFYSFVQDPDLIVEDLTDLSAGYDFCKSENCSDCAEQINNCSALKMIGFSSVQDIKSLEESNISLLRFITQNNNLVFEKNVTESSSGCLHLRWNKFFPIASSLAVKSNIRICGNESTIMAYAIKLNDDETFERTNMNIITNNDFNNPISNVTFENITFKGTYPFYDEENKIRVNQDGAALTDQCVYTLTENPLLKNLHFDKVTFTGFRYAIHSSSIQKNSPTESSCWSFDHCKFTECATPIVISFIDDVSFTNCRFNASLSKRETEHCLYISGGTSHIKVDNCLLENAMGAGFVNGSSLNAIADDELSEEIVPDSDLLTHDNSFTNLQIRNCNIGVTIGNPSENILIENVFVTNVARALVLNNCKNVIVNNFNASGCFYYEYMRMDPNGITHWGNVYNDWFALAIRGYVQAKITNSFFSTGGLMFTCSKSFFPTNNLGNKIDVDIDFENCIFTTTFSEYRMKEDGTYESPECSLGISKTVSENSDQYFCYNVDFTRCQFYMNSENNEKSMITLRGYPGEGAEKSVYSFYKCIIAYRDGNGNPNDDVITYFNGTPVIAMPKGYFISPNSGTHAKIIGCTFYNNRDVFPENSDEGFVKSSLIHNCTIDNGTKYDQKLVITDNDASLENDEVAE